MLSVFLSIDYYIKFKLSHSRKNLNIYCVSPRQESRQVQLKLLHGLERPASSEEQEKEEESEIAEEEERPNKDEGDGA